MVRVKDGYRFDSTGNQFYANGFICIQKRTDGVIEIAQGYDGSIDIEDSSGNTLFDDTGDIMELSSQEKIELSLHIIDIWKEFAGI